MEIKGEYRENESYADLLHWLRTHAKLEVGAIKYRGYGGILNIISDTNDTDQQRALDIVIKELGIKPFDIRYIDVEKIVLAIDLGIKKYQLGIPEDVLGLQSMAENVFQIAYRDFGENGEGWRIGMTWILDSIQKEIEEHAADLRGTPFEDFLNALDLGGLEDEVAEFHPARLVVLHYPVLDDKNKLEKATDADVASLDPDLAERIEKYLHIFSLITQVYPGKFNSKNNPNGMVLVNLIDTSYRWFSARNIRWHEAYEFICGQSVETPKSVYRDQRLMSTL